MKRSHPATTLNQRQYLHLVAITSCTLWLVLRTFRTYEGFINFDRSFQQFGVGIPDGGADAVAEIPSGLIGDLQDALQLVRRYPLAGFTHQVDCGKPLLERKVGIMEDRSSGNGELVAA